MENRKTGIWAARASASPFGSAGAPPAEEAAGTAALRQDMADAARALDEARRNWLGDRSDRTRTLTALYNKKPTWLADAHRTLDAAVFAAYGWEPQASDDQILERLLALNLSRGQAGGSKS